MASGAGAVDNGSGFSARGGAVGFAGAGDVGGSAGGDETSRRRAQRTSRSRAFNTDTGATHIVSKATRGRPIPVAARGRPQQAIATLWPNATLVAAPSAGSGPDRLASPTPSNTLGQGSSSDGNHTSAAMSATAGS